MIMYLIMLRGFTVTSLQCADWFQFRSDAFTSFSHIGYCGLYADILYMSVPLMLDSCAGDHIK